MPSSQTRVQNAVLFLSEVFSRSSTDHEIELTMAEGRGSEASFLDPSAVLRALAEQAPVTARLISDAFCKRASLEGAREGVWSKMG